MSIITELRAEVFQNNTAQQTLLSILDRIKENKKPSEQKEGENDRDYLLRLSQEHITQKKFIESHHKYTSEFEFSESFSGDLDLSIFAELGFRAIRTIIFTK